jgi:hypothetical protein
MMKLNREQIVKTIQDCIDRPNCTECPNLTLCSGHGFEYLLVQTLALIKKFTEENERLNTSCTELKQECKKWQGRLKIECEYTKADTVRKMQERLTSDEFYIMADDYDGMQYVDFCAWVEDVAKEVLEENNV